MVLRLRQPIRRIGSRRATTRRSFQRGGCLPTLSGRLLCEGHSCSEGATCEVDTVLLRQSPFAGGTRKRGVVSRRAIFMEKSLADGLLNFLIKTAATLPSRGYFSSKICVVHLSNVPKTCCAQVLGKPPI